VIGLLLHRRSKLPWIAEFRDPMLQHSYPHDKWNRRSFSKIERSVFEYAREIVVTTDGCKRMYLDRYRSWNENHISTIPNGYDPGMFAALSDVPIRGSQEPFILLHSGLLYPSERNPAQFFQAVRALSETGFLDKHPVEFHFRASGNEEHYIDAVRRVGIAKYVRILPRVPYLEAISEMRRADALMVFQAQNCNDQIPAKVYEYMYCQKPILALTEPQGDTGQLLNSVGVQSIAKLED